MNKRKVDQAISRAYDVLNEIGIVEEINGEPAILKGYKSQISAFGASISMGSLISAVSFYSEKGNAAVDRTKLMKAIYIMINEQEKLDQPDCTLWEYIKETLSECNDIKYRETHAILKEQVINYSIALKLAMNLYPLKDDAEIGEKDNGGENEQ